MSLSDAVLQTGFAIIRNVGPELFAALAAGVPAGRIETAVRLSIRAAEAAAVARVEARAGQPSAPLRVAAIHLEDVAEELIALGQTADAEILKRLVEKFRAG